jgi:hypothetical protein
MALPRFAAASSLARRFQAAGVRHALYRRHWQQPHRGAPAGAGQYRPAIPLCPADPRGLTLNAPNGVTSDTSGNIYILDNGNTRFIEVTQAGVAGVLCSVKLGANAFHCLTSDGGATFTCAENGEVVELAAGTRNTTTHFSGCPLVVSLDAAGDVFIAGFDISHGMGEIPASGSPQVVNLG